MSKNRNIQDEFYIGYLPEAPPGTARVIKRLTVVGGLLLVLLAALIASRQTPFSDAVFAFGTLTEHSGYYFHEPVPHLVSASGKGSDLVLLVGFGKAGASATMKAIEAQSNTSLNGKMVTLVGTQIYGDGKNLLQVTPEDNEQIAVSTGEPVSPPAFTPVGEHTFLGEIIDPKCYFGVMKPGEGKPHRSCAIRCIAGGIPPVLRSVNGPDDYLILSGVDVDNDILPLVGEPVTITGKVFAYGDWKVIKPAPGALKSQLSEMRQRKLLEEDRKMTTCAR